MTLNSGTGLQKQQLNAKLTQFYRLPIHRPETRWYWYKSFICIQISSFSSPLSSSNTIYHTERREMDKNHSRQQLGSGKTWREREENRKSDKM